MTATATNPIWVIKTRLQLEAKHQERILANESSAGAAVRSAAAAVPGKKSIGMLPAFTMTKDILAKEGLKGLYKGMSASYLGVTEGVIQWVLYEVRTSTSRSILYLFPLRSA
jgi:solute carrier family 25 protein 33/36